MNKTNMDFQLDIKSVGHIDDNGNENNFTLKNNDTSRKTSKLMCPKSLIVLKLRNIWPFCLKYVIQTD